MALLLEIVNVVWPAGSAVAWFTGSTILQTRARRQPLDLRLNLMVLMLTVVAFHLVAYINIAAQKQAVNLAAIPLLDVALTIVALVGIKRRTKLTERCFWMYTLIFFGSLSFWTWYVLFLGGLVSR